MIKWFQRTFSEEGYASASRQLFAVLMVTVCVSLLIDVCHRGIGPSWAAVATGLASALGAVWWKGKSNEPRQ